MWQVIGKIFGSGKVVEKGLDLIDSMHTSKEEEIAANNQAKVNLLNAYAPFKLAQRVLAFMFAGTFLGSFLLCLGMTLFGGLQVAAIISLLNVFYIGEIMLAIISFYFCGGFLEGVFRARNEGKGGVIQHKEVQIK